MKREIHKLTMGPGYAKPRLTLRGVSVVFFIYMLYAALYTFMIVRGDPEHIPFVPTYIGVFLGNILEMIYSLVPWFIVIRQMDHSPWPAKIAAHAVLAPLFAWGWFETYIRLFRALFGPVVLEMAQLHTNRLWVMNGAFTVYIIQFAILHIIRSIQRLHEREQQAAMLQELAREREIAALKAQINPHFLFNTLNTISAMVTQKPEVSRQMIAKLAELMRYALQSFDRHFVRLEEELQFIKTYLDFEQQRFSDRLEVETQVDPQVLKALVPPMILQPLVENAVRHGISPSEQGGKIYLEVGLQNDRLLFMLRDTGHQMNGKPTSALFDKGVGLKNTDTRLQQTFGANSTLHIQNSKERGFEVTFSIPMITQEPVG